ncbi:MAG: ribonuclease III [Syntrophaceae bacterium]|nr:ribonuclease III [Syntrophaceae bacterium]
MEEERLASLRELEGRIGYRFHDIEWLNRALTHGSFLNESDPSTKRSNEVLEFLGDAVLNLAVSHLLLQRFPDAQEGMLSMKRAHLVKQSSLALLAREIRLEEHLLLGKSELLNRGKEKSSILANAYEALFGAIYIDSGLGPVLGMLKKLLEPYLQSEPPFPSFQDYKSLLQEKAQPIYGLSPDYQVLKESGPDHDKRFQASVAIHGEVKGIGWGKSKKEAEQEAARKALSKLEIRNTKSETDPDVQNTNDLSK